MNKISVKKVSEDKTKFTFNVEVREGVSKTLHLVTVTKSFYVSLETEKSPEAVVKKSFEFLLERESKESILAEFDITVISKYFPEYETKLKDF